MVTRLTGPGSRRERNDVSSHESWLLPLATILIVPMCLLSAIGGIAWMGMTMTS